MRYHHRWAAILPFLLSAAISADPAAAETWTYTVSMNRPTEHLFHVSLRCEGLAAETVDLRMPAWMPGFYKILDYQAYVSGFRAADGKGRALPWEKVTRSTWRIVSGGAPVLVVEYDVLGNVHFAARNNIDATRAFIAPPGMFLYSPGRLQRPVTVVLRHPDSWKTITTGLDPVSGRPGTFTAPDFDTLYDCPILLGSQECLEFTVQGVPHRAALESIPAEVDRARIAADLKKIVEASTGLIGDIPYRHYAFQLIGSGNGGIEHANSEACFFNGRSLADPKGYLGWLSYIAHEYFHCFNVKRIRPLALGPFDYDAENTTDLLWVSEGLTVYYEDIVLVRAGLMTPAQFRDRLAAAMTRFEGAPGHRYQSATEASLQTWGGSGMGGDRAVTISYYDNGSLLGALLDLAIRRSSGNRRSLDDVMRTLYRTYDRGRKRGFTDAEFRSVCETAAGAALDEVFSYAATTRDVDYAKYLAYAGWRVETAWQDAPGAFLGLDVQAAEGGLRVAGVTEGSPAEAAGLRPGDLVLEIDGARAAVKGLSEALTAGKPGGILRLRAVGRGSERVLEMALVPARKPVYTIVPIDNPGSAEAALERGWLGK
jgi:predicted metalloprotease with PDZ domain